MPVTTTAKASGMNWTAMMWLAFALSAPQAVYMLHWDFVSDAYKDNPTATLVYAAAQGANGVILILALLAALRLGSTKGKSFSIAVVSTYVIGLILFQLADFLWMTKDTAQAESTDWYAPLASLKETLGFSSTTPAWNQWVNLSGFVATILWVVVILRETKSEVIADTLDRFSDADLIL